MAGRPATVLQADVRRILRAAKLEGYAVAEVHLGPDAKIIVRLASGSDPPPPDPETRIIL